jgi:hypothetical protein
MPSPSSSTAPFDSSAEPKHIRSAFLAIFCQSLYENSPSLSASRRSPSPLNANAWIAVDEEICFEFTGPAVECAGNTSDFDDGLEGVFPFDGRWVVAVRQSAGEMVVLRGIEPASRVKREADSRGGKIGMIS